LQECLRNIHRIVEIRLNDKFGVEPTSGNLVWDWQEKLAAHRPGLRREGPAHRHVPHRRPPRLCGADRTQMRECGFDDVAMMP
jgi:N-carbamoyl-L-amino-acid hydrolase